ncbi:MAG: S-formylglutathione hydrolase [Rhodospirillales bacterium]|nr:S-formylglutathione hydrolase [Rhodospirillales bacterium]
MSAAPRSDLELIRRHRAFAGEQAVYRHPSVSTGTPMEFSIFIPPQAAEGARPVVFYLSGLTCTWANVTEKGGFQRLAAELGLIVVCPDTSPRGADLPGEDEAYDFGSGAGFYVDATVDPWSRHYRMATYVEEELPALVAAHFPADINRLGLFGHSMGGHGALTMALRTPERYRSLSALAPVVAPSQVPWGRKAFAGYLGPETGAWRRYDATALARETRWRGPILIDQGTADEFREVQLRPELFAAACAGAGIPVELRLQEGYDHSYYFIATFMDDHLRHHARQLGLA